MLEHVTYIVPAEHRLDGLGSQAISCDSHKLYMTWKGQPGVPEREPHWSLCPNKVKGELYLSQFLRILGELMNCGCIMPSYIVSAQMAFKAHMDFGFPISCILPVACVFASSQWIHPRRASLINEGKLWMDTARP